MDVTQYLDMDSMEWKTRPCTPEEQAEINERRTAGPTVEDINEPILKALTLIDQKTPRAVREAIKTGDNSRVIALESEAAELRAKLVKD